MKPLLIALLLVAPLAAQTGDETNVRAFVEDFLTRLGDARYDTLDGDFVPAAVIVVARERNGAWTSSSEAARTWIAALAKNPAPTKFREPISNVKITVDSGQLAWLRADFKVVRDGSTLSSGVDEFTLVRDGDRWKIAAIAYTSMPVR